MIKKIIVVNLIVKICASMFTLGLVILNIWRAIFGGEVDPFALYFMIALIIVATSVWIPLYHIEIKKKGVKKVENKTN